jgi:riboflavin synthase
MFTGLIEEVGRVLWIRAGEHGVELEVAAAGIAEGVRTGDSIAVNGCCLTITAHRSGQMTFDLLAETLERTNLKALRRDSTVNLERPLRADARLGGHFVQGHIDCVSQILSLEQVGKDYRLRVKLPREFSELVAYKGSIAIDGISLTVAEIGSEDFAVWIIPHTRRVTNLQNAQPGEPVNLEFDILAKYVQRMLRPNEGDQPTRDGKLETVSKPPA